MERSCGKIDYRLQKLKDLEAASKSVIFQYTESLKENSEVSFRTFAEAAKKVKDLKIEWKEKTQALFQQGASEKEVIALKNEGKRLLLLDELKKIGGPFTSPKEIEEFMMNNEITEDDKRKRMKNEMKFARDSSTSLPKSDPIFRVMVTLPNKKRRDKTPAEFAEALKALLKKRLDVSKEGLSIDTFKNSLKNVLSQSQV